MYVVPPGNKGTSINNHNQYISICVLNKCIITDCVASSIFSASLIPVKSYCLQPSLFVFTLVKK